MKKNDLFKVDDVVTNKWNYKGKVKQLSDGTLYTPMPGFKGICTQQKQWKKVEE